MNHIKATLPNWLTYGILLIVAFMFVFLFSCTTSPLYEHYPFWFHGDSGVFQEMGICLLQGGTPYIDLFDHKGPVLWFIQALGIWLNFKWGLIILQALALFFNLVLWYKTIVLITEKEKSSIVFTFVGLLFLMSFYQRGNLCEEWSLLFISLPLYLYVKRWKNKSEADNSQLFTHIDTFVLGLCVGVLSMIRLNNTAPLIGFAVWHFVNCIKSKNFRALIFDIGLICAGVTLIVVLCSTFFYIKAGWTGVREMIYGTIIFNFEYIGGAADLPLKDRLLHFAPLCGIFAVTLICLMLGKKYLGIVIPTIISYIVTTLSIGTYGFLHYMMVFIPLIIISASATARLSLRWVYVLWVFILSLTTYLGYDAVDRLLFRVKGNKADTEINDGFHRFISSMPSIERKSIYNANVNHMSAGLFADENIYQCNRIIHRFHLDISSHLRVYEAEHGIQVIKPVWVLTQGKQDDVFDDYLLSHYFKADSIPCSQYDTIFCWKRIN